MKEGRDRLMITTLTASDVFQNWLDSSRSANTKDSYKRVIPQFFNLTLNVTIDELNKDMLESLLPSLVERKYKTRLMDQGYKQSTIINYLTIIGSFLHQLEINRVFEGVNYPYIRSEVLSSKRMKDDTAPRKKMGTSDYDNFYEWLLEKEFSKRYADKGVRYAAALKFMFTTAVRVSSTFNNIRWKNFVREEDFHGQEGWTIYALDKGDKVNRKPITDEYYQELKATLYEGNDEDLVFKGLNKQSFTRLMKQYSDEIGKVITPHSIKVGAGTKLYAMTKDIVMVQKFLDHEDPSTTVRYIRTDDDRTQTGSFVLANKIDVSKLEDLTRDELLEIIRGKSDLSYGVMLEAKSKGVI